GPLLVGEDGDRAGVGEGLDEEVGGGGEVVGGHGDAAQLLAQPPFGEGVGAAERGVQEAGRGGLVEPLDAPSDEDDAQQIPDGGVGGQRQVVGGLPGGHADVLHGPAQVWDGRGGFDDDGHLGVGGALEQVGAAQRVGDVDGFAGGRGQVHDRGRALGVGVGAAPPVPVRSAQPLRQRHGGGQG